MNTIEVNFTIEPVAPFRDILIAELSELGFESFVEQEKGLSAYVSFSAFQATNLQALEVSQLQEVSINYEVKEIPAQNWNAVWESNFDPIHVGDQCLVRAPFHEVKQPFEHEIVISPKMSFGTGHHETTFLMLSQMLELPWDDKTVLDMGCGTGVLAVLAEQKGAREVLAIDIDEWAYENTKENLELNKTQKIEVQKGGADLLEGKSFNVILANINKNVLLNDLSAYVQALQPGGRLLMSGFFVVDADDLMKATAAFDLSFVRQTDRNDWTTMMFEKKS